MMLLAIRSGKDSIRCKYILSTGRLHGNNYLDEKYNRLNGENQVDFEVELAKQTGIRGCKNTGSRNN